MQRSITMTVVYDIQDLNGEERGTAGNSGIAGSIPEISPVLRVWRSLTGNHSDAHSDLPWIAACE
jgi:hypothetical protein